MLVFCVFCCCCCCFCQANPCGTFIQKNAPCPSVLSGPSVCSLFQYLYCCYIIVYYFKGVYECALCEYYNSIMLGAWDWLQLLISAMQSIWLIDSFRLVGFRSASQPTSVCRRLLVSSLFTVDFSWRRVCGRSYWTDDRQATDNLVCSTRGPTDIGPRLYPEKSLVPNKPYGFCGR